MGQFTLAWSSDAEVANSYVTGQKLYYRLKGAPTWSTDGWTTTVPPPNASVAADGKISKTIEGAISKNLTDNAIYDFKVAGLCELQGEIANDNGVQQGINFACAPISTIISVASTGYNSITVSATALPEDFSKITFHLRSLGGAVDQQTKIQPVSDGVMATFQFTGLNPLTTYDIWWEMWAFVSNPPAAPVEISSNSAGQVGALCGPKSVITQELPSCSMPTGLSVVAT